MSKLFTSESVTAGHPDKVADQISDAILDAMLEQDPDSRVACETMVSTGMVVVAGEITTKAYVDIPSVVRNTIKDIGYTDPKTGFDYENCAVLISLDEQSPDISQGVSEGEGLHKEQGAGDQGLMFGYACNETCEVMPVSIVLAHIMTRRLAEEMAKGSVEWLRPDGKSQVTVEYGDDDKPVRVHTVVVSTQHTDDVEYEEIKKWVTDCIILPSIPEDLKDDEIIIHVNPTGKFVTGGPKGDCGLTGRKIIVDTYGGVGRHGGGAFSGKDPSKVDRSASYMARFIAKNLVAAEAAEKCEVQLAYAIGVADPVSVLVNTFGTGKVDDEYLGRVVQMIFNLTPSAIIEYLDLKRPIYRETAKNGHFGKVDFPWEKLDTIIIEDIRKFIDDK